MHVFTHEINDKDILIFTCQATKTLIKELIENAYVELEFDTISKGLEYKMTKAYLLGYLISRLNDVKLVDIHIV